MPPEDDDLEEFDADELHGMEEVEVDDFTGDADGGGDSEYSDEEDEDMDMIDESKFTFNNHNGSVFCIDISRNDAPLVVTGGEDDKGFVWNYNTSEVLFECQGHKDSVTCCGFSSDSKYVMTADMGGTVLVFNTSDGKNVWEYECSDLEWCKWHKSAHVLFAGTSSGDVYMWKIPSGDCKIYASHGCRTTCGGIMPNGKEIIVGYEDGSIKKWDLKTVACIFHYKPNKEDAIICIDILSVGQKNGSLIACGTQSGAVNIVNTHTGKLISNFSVSTNNSNDPDMEDEEQIEINSIECVTFSPCASYISCASLNGNLCVWDISNERVRHECRNPAGVSKLIWCESEPNYIISSCLDGVIRMWDYKNGELFKEYYGHLGNILDLSLSGDGKYILTAGDDGTARLFEK